jgi:hypothetical protein
MTTTAAPRIDQLTDAVSGLSTQLSIPAVNLTYRTATTTTGAPTAGVFYSSITGRAKMVDLSADLCPRMGIERIPVQQIMRVDGETGLAGEAVWKPVNDKFDQIRFVGNFSSVNSTGGQFILRSSGSSTDYVEITFYGTGLNIAALLGGTGYDMRVTTDGGTESGNITATNYSSVLNGRSYSVNTIINAVSGLSLGMHTVKIRFADAGSNGVYGFEILNEQFLTTTANTNSSTSLTSVASTTGLVVGMNITGTGIPANTTISGISGNTITMSAAATATATGVAVKFGTNTIKIAPGSSSINGAGRTLSAIDTEVYNSGFESGTLNARGGHVVIYQKADGAIGKAVTPTNPSSATLTSANHSNEEVIRTYSLREFGSARADDFSVVLSSSSRAFTLDDGTTTLVCFNADSFSGTGTDSLRLGTLNSFYTLTFIGTGLDIVTAEDPGTTTRDTLAVTIDGTLQGNLPTIASTISRTERIISGLPYGTHTVKVSLSSAGNGRTNFSRFIVYGPKKPTIPAGAVELADYFVMADYVQLSSLSGVANKEKISVGVLKKPSIREFAYSGTWTANLDVTNSEVGWRVYSNTASSYAEYTFFGTGIELRGSLSTVAGSQTISIDGSSNLSSYSTNFIYGSSGMTFTPATGIISGTSAANNSFSLKISNMPLGIHKIRIAYTSGDNTIINSVDVITPIHTHKNNGPFVVQNTLSVGSQGVNDSRKFGDQLPVARSVSQTYGISSSSTTTSSSAVPLIDMSTTVKSNGNPIKISYSAQLSSNTAASGFATIIYVNGVSQPIGQAYGIMNSTISKGITLTGTAIITLPAGYHKIDVYWVVGGGIASTLGSGTNYLTAEEMSII